MPIPYLDLVFIDYYSFKIRIIIEIYILKKRYELSKSVFKRWLF